MRSNYQQRTVRWPLMLQICVLWLQLLAWQVGSVQPTCVHKLWLPFLHWSQVQEQTGAVHL